jgi:hypothetical protein
MKVFQVREKNNQPRTGAALMVAEISPESLHAGKCRECCCFCSQNPLTKPYTREARQ